MINNISQKLDFGLIPVNKNSSNSNLYNINYKRHSH